MLRDGSSEHSKYEFGKAYDADYVDGDLGYINIYKNGLREDTYPIEGNVWQWGIIPVAPTHGVQAKESDRKEVASAIREIVECFNDAIKECHVVGIDIKVSLVDGDLKVEMTHQPDKRVY